VIFNIEGEDRWNLVNEGDQGFVVVTAHIGYWEVGSRLGLTESGRKVHVVREIEADPRAQEFIENLMNENSEEGYVVHFVSKSDPSLGTRLLSALRQGDVVALQADRPRANGATGTASLFGNPLELPLGPSALARAAGVPLVPVFLFREGRHRSTVSIRSPIWVSSTSNRQADLSKAIQELADEISVAILRMPHQWFCFRELWPDS
jgi:lauroyl/myristoyl acyltransferase